MKIAVNTRLLIKGKLDGIGWFTYHSLKNIVTNHPEHQFYFFFDRQYSDEFIFSDNVTPIIIGPPTRHPFLWYFWFKHRLPKALKKLSPDIFLSPDGFLPDTNIPTVNVIHDINFAHNPEDLPFFIRQFYNRYFPKYAKHSNAIATVSEFSKQDIAKQYNVPLEKIDVVYNGSDKRYKPINQAEKEKIKQQFTDGKNFFIFIGSIHPRKNITRLIQAFNLFKINTLSDLKLVIVGNKFFKNKELFSVYQSLEYKDDIIFTGRLEIEILNKVLASATALTFVPYFEGFGIPILEALYCDVPVISANVTSMPEVAGDAAIYVNPFDIEEIAEAMSKLYSDENLCQTLIKKGQIQREKFSWEQTAEKLWNIILKIEKNN